MNWFQLTLSNWNWISLKPDSKQSDLTLTRNLNETEFELELTFIWILRKVPKIGKLCLGGSNYFYLDVGLLLDYPLCECANSETRCKKENATSGPGPEDVGVIFFLWKRRKTGKKKETWSKKKTKKDCIFHCVGVLISPGSWRALSFFFNRMWTLNDAKQRQEEDI